MLDINSEINIRTSDGAVAKLNSARIDMAAGRMSTDKPVEIRFKDASINSDALTVEQNGKLVVFEKRVRVHIVPPRPTRPVNEGEHRDDREQVRSLSSAPPSRSLALSDGALQAQETATGRLQGLSLTSDLPIQIESDRSK